MVSPIIARLFLRWCLVEEESEKKQLSSSTSQLRFVRKEQLQNMENFSDRHKKLDPHRP